MGQSGQLARREEVGDGTKEDEDGSSQTLKEMDAQYV